MKAKNTFTRTICCGQRIPRRKGTTWRCRCGKTFVHVPRLPMPRKDDLLKKLELPVSVLDPSGRAKNVLQACKMATRDRKRGQARMFADAGGSTAADLKRHGIEWEGSGKRP